MELLTVGKPYPGGVLSPGNNYNYREGEHELLVCMSDLSAGEITAFKTGEAKFALTVLQGIIFLCYRFGDQPWCDAPYHWWIVPEDQRVEPPITIGDTRAILHVILLETSGCIVRALRTCTVSPRFTRLLHQNIREQMQPISDQEYSSAISGIYDRFSSGDLAKNALITCKGGD